MAAAVPPAPARSFAELDLPPALAEAVARLGYTSPTDIQAHAIPALRSGRDVTGVARTGTGKTAAFGLPLIEAVDPAQREVQGLVLCPTRELALQVAEALTGFSAGIPGVSVVAVYGGAPFVPQKRALAAGTQIVVGTPGRIMDHLDRGTLRLDGVRFVALDEADEMLRMGFAEDVEKILSGAPRERQTALFSATMPPAIRRVAQNHLRDPLDVTIATENRTAHTVTQEFAIVPFRERADALARTLETHPADGTIVFVRTKSACDEVAAALAVRGIRSAVLNGDVPQSDRERIVQRLRGGAVDVLVATDVAARGLDVDRIELVVNFDVPDDVEVYVHRIGRTGRAERVGHALTFLAPRERYMVRRIENATGATLTEITPPGQEQVFLHRTTAALAAVATRLDAPRIEAYRRAVAAHAAEAGLDPADMAAALLALAAGDDGSWVPPTPVVDRPARPRTPRERTERGDRGDRDGRPRRPSRAGEKGIPYRINIGRRHGVRPAAIVGAVTGAGRLDGSAVGRIDIHEDFTIVEMMGEINEATRKRIAVARIGGQRLHMEPDPTHHGGPPRRPRAGRDPRAPRSRSHAVPRGR